MMRPPEEHVFDESTLQAVEISAAEIKHSMMSDWRDATGHHFLVPCSDINRDNLHKDLIRKDFYLQPKQEGEAESPVKSLSGLFFTAQKHYFNGEQDRQALQGLIVEKLGLSEESATWGEVGSKVCFPQPAYNLSNHLLAQQSTEAMNIDGKSVKILNADMNTAVLISVSHDAHPRPRITVQAHINAINATINDEQVAIPVDVYFNYQLVFNDAMGRYELDVGSLKKGGEDAELVEEALRNEQLSEATMKKLLNRHVYKENPYKGLIEQAETLEKNIRKAFEQESDIQRREDSLAITKDMKKLIYSSLREYVQVAEGAAKEGAQASILAECRTECEKQLESLKALWPSHNIDQKVVALTSERPADVLRGWGKKTAKEVNTPAAPATPAATHQPANSSAAPVVRAAPTQPANRSAAPAFYKKLSFWAGVGGVLAIAGMVAAAAILLPVAAACGVAIGLGIVAVGIADGMRRSDDSSPKETIASEIPDVRAVKSSSQPRPAAAPAPSTTPESSVVSQSSQRRADSDASSRNNTPLPEIHLRCPSPVPDSNSSDASDGTQGRVTPFADVTLSVTTGNPLSVGQTPERT